MKEKSPQKLTGASPSQNRNTLRDYQEMISDDDDGFGGRAYRANQNSKKKLRFQRTQENFDTSDADIIKSGINIVDLKARANSDLSDYNIFQSESGNKEESPESGGCEVKDSL
jgi:hypothetical protein